MLCPLSYEGRALSDAGYGAAGANRHPGEAPGRRPDGVSNAAPEYVSSGLGPIENGAHFQRQEYSHARSDQGPGMGEGPTIAKRYDMRGARP